MSYIKYNKKQKNKIINNIVSKGIIKIII